MEIKYNPDLVKDLVYNQREYERLVINEEDKKRIKSQYKEMNDFIAKHDNAAMNANAMGSMNYMDKTLANNYNKKIKVNPFIAGGAASGVIGPAGGVVAAAEASKRNEKIDAARDKYSKSSFETGLKLKHAADLVDSYNYSIEIRANNIKEILDKTPEIVKLRKTAKEKYLEEEKAAKEEKYKSAIQLMKMNPYIHPFQRKQASKIFKSIEGYKDTAAKYKQNERERAKPSAVFCLIVSLAFAAIVASFFKWWDTIINYGGDLKIFVVIVTGCISFVGPFITAFIVLMVNLSKTK